MQVYRYRQRAIGLVFPFLVFSWVVLLFDRQRDTESVVGLVVLNLVMVPTIGLNMRNNRLEIVGSTLRYFNCWGRMTVKCTFKDIQQMKFFDGREDSGTEVVSSYGSFCVDYLERRDELLEVIRKHRPELFPRFY